MIAAPIVEDACVTAVVLLQWKDRYGVFERSDGVLLERLAGLLDLALRKHPVHDTILDGTTEAEMRKWLKEDERGSTATPASLRMEKGEAALLLSKSFRIADFMEVDGNFMKIPFHLLHRLGARKRWPFTNDIFFRFLVEIRRASGERWMAALESACHLAHILVNADLLTIIRPVEILALLIAALAHRVESRSVADAQVPEGFRVLLAKQSLVESRICLAVMRILAKPSANVFAGFPAETLALAWKLLVELILALDWAQLPQLIAQAGDANLIQRWTALPEGRLLILKLILKAATIMRAAQSRESADGWAEQVLQQEQWQLAAAGVGDDKIRLFRMHSDPLFQLLTRLFPPLGSPFRYLA
jgi:hypothetical protein